MLPIRLKEVDADADMKSVSRARICFFCNNSANNLYTCPRCSFAYCSSKCYQSPDHRYCSEAFYREECMKSMQNRKVDIDDVKKVEDILSRHYKAQCENDDDDAIEVETLHHASHSNIDHPSAVNNNDDDDDRFHKLIESGAIGQCVDAAVAWWFETVNVINFPFALLPVRSLTRKQIDKERVWYSIIAALVGYVVIFRRYNGDFGGGGDEDVSRDWLSMQPDTTKILSLSNLLYNQCTKAKSVLGIDKLAFWSGLIGRDVCEGLLVSKNNCLHALLECWRLMKRTSVLHSCSQSHNPFSRKTSTIDTNDLSLIQNAKKFLKKLKFQVFYVNDQVGACSDHLIQQIMDLTASMMMMC